MAQASWSAQGLTLGTWGMRSGVSPAGRAWGESPGMSPFSSISMHRQQVTPGCHPLWAAGPCHHLSNHCQSNSSISSWYHSIFHQSYLKWDIQVVSLALLMELSYLHFQGSEGSKLYPPIFIFVADSLRNLRYWKWSREFSRLSSQCPSEKRFLSPPLPTQEASSCLHPSCWPPLPGLTSPLLVVSLSITFTCGLCHLSLFIFSHNLNWTKWSYNN